MKLKLVIGIERGGDAGEVKEEFYMFRTIFSIFIRSNE